MKIRSDERGPSWAVARTAIVGTLLAGIVAVTSGAVQAGASSTPSNVKAEETQAKQQLLVKSDFPTGWSGQGSVTTSYKNGGAPSFPGGQQLVNCLGISQYLVNLNTPMATSPTFGSKNGLETAQDAVNVFPSQKVANEANAVLAGPKMVSCFNTVLQGPARSSFTSGFGKGVTVGAITVAATNRALLISHAIGFTIAFPTTSQGLTLNVSISLVSVPHGKTDSQLTFTGVGSGFSPSQARHLETVAYGRT